MAGPEPLEQSAEVRAAASNLRVDAATAEVLRAFREAAVDALLLKGPALSSWYAADPSRTYLDSDLWIAPSDLMRAATVLESLGFHRDFDESGLPEWWQEHAAAWLRDADGVVVDLHRTLQGIAVDPATAWEVLTDHRETVVVGGYEAPILSTPARALYVAVHAAHHGRAWGKALSHLERALDEVQESEWHEVVSLAERLRASDSLAAGLRLLPDGAELAARLDLPQPESVRVALHAKTPPPVALGFEQLASAHSHRARVRILLRKAVPPAAFIRHWWPPAARGRWMLAVGYVYRPLWLLLRAPRGFRAWREARREVRGNRS